MVRSTRGRRGLLLIVAALAMVFTACGDDDDGDEETGAAREGEAGTRVSAPSQALLEEIPSPEDDNRAQPEGTYVAAVPNSQYYLALVVQGQEVAGYVCNGTDFSDWFGGSSDGTAIDLVSDDGTEVTGTVQDDSVTGTLVVQGESFDYEARPAEGPPGLYRQTVAEEGQEYLRGWILTEDGVRGLDSADGEARNALSTAVPSGTPTGTEEGLGSGTEGTGGVTSTTALGWTQQECDAANQALEGYFNSISRLQKSKQTATTAASIASFNKAINRLQASACAGGCTNVLGTGGCTI
jgi:hypothetical protein